MIADAAANPPPGIAPLILGSSVLAGALTLAGKLVDMVNSRAGARRQLSVDPSGLSLRALQVPKRTTRHGLLRTLLVIAAVYCFAVTVAFPIAAATRFVSPSALWVSAISGFGLAVSLFLLKQVNRGSRGGGTLTARASLWLEAPKDDVMERCRYALNRIGCVVVSYATPSGRITAQRGRLGQDLVVTVIIDGPVCAVTVTSSAAVALLPPLAAAANTRNVRRFADLVVGGFAEPKGRARPARSDSGASQSGSSPEAPNTA